MRPRPILALIVLGIAGAVALTGCAAATHPDAGPTKTSAPIATPTPTPTPSKPTLGQLVVSPDGLADLVVGAAVPVHSAQTAIMTFDPTKCVDATEGIAAGSPGAGAWLPAYPDSLTYAGAGMPFDVGPLAAETDPIRQIAIWSPDLKTATGVGVGSTPAQITSAYGSAIKLDSAANSDVYVLPGAHSELLFEVAKAGAGLPVEETGTVVWMHIVSLGETQLHYANSDAAGVCSFG
jgi:hypothetical protein